MPRLVLFLVALTICLSTATGCHWLNPLIDPPRHEATIPVNRAEPQAVAERNEKLQQRVLTEGQSAETLFIGDSITQGWENEGREAWAGHLARFMPLNLGVSGDRTEHVLYRLDTYVSTHKLNPKAVVILIGTNNVHRDDWSGITDGITAIVIRARRAWPGANIIVMKVFPRSELPTAKERATLIQVNERLEQQIRGTSRIEFLDINSQLLESDGRISKSIMPDFLHLSPQGYEIWAKALEKRLERIIKK